MITTYTDQEKRIMQELEPLGVAGWHATHGLNQRFHCAYCDRDFLESFDAYHSLQFDHIIPQSGGGEHTEENTVACCSTCNFLKHTYSPAGNSREERIVGARRYVKERRSLLEAEVRRIRLLVELVQRNENRVA